jgi:acyl-CoA dehydrogenase
MDFGHSQRAQRFMERVAAFIRAELEPIEEDLRRTLREAPDPWRPSPVLEELRSKAKADGLWNLFLPDADLGAGLSNVDYAPVAELTGRSVFAPYVFNSNAPDTGNMEVLVRYGSQEQRDRWLRPLLAGEIRSAFCMTEPDVASSDATNMAATVRVEGETAVVNGRKWWSTNVGHPDCKVAIFMGVGDPTAERHRQHTMVLVPMDAPGVRVERLLPAMGHYDEPFGHGEVSFTDVRVPAENIVAGPGRAFEIAQGRLGPGRVHHCMRLVGLAEKALELACSRGTSRVAFGRRLVDLGGNRERIADARIAISQARLLVLHAAWLLDTQGSSGALSAVSQIKVAVPLMAQRVIDMAIQMHGGAGVSEDFPLAAAFASARSLRLADGPDEVHRAVIAKVELAPYLEVAP